MGYKDVDGKPITLRSLVVKEPWWAASRISDDRVTIKNLRAELRTVKNRAVELDEENEKLKAQLDRLREIAKKGLMTIDDDNRSLLSRIAATRMELRRIAGEGKP